MFFYTPTPFLCPCVHTCSAESQKTSLPDPTHCPKYDVPEMHANRTACRCLCKIDLQKSVDGLVYLVFEVMTESSWPKTLVLKPIMRRRFFRLSVFSVFFGLIVLWGDNQGQSQPPYELPPNASDAELQEVVVPLSDAVKRKIAEALSRESSAATSDQSTGDPILDDVLSVIRRQGSVLDGSSLDLRSGPRQTDNPQTGGVPTDVPLPNDSLSEQLPRAGRRGAKSPDQGPDARFVVAESLLRTARRLASLPGSDAQRQRLVAAMREQATVLMLDEFSQTTTETR